MSFWESSAFWGIAGIVASIIVSTFFFIHGKNRKTLKYKIHSIHSGDLNEWLSDDLLSQLGNYPSVVDTILNFIDASSSIIVFSNSGNHEITLDDFSKSVPLMISAERIYFYKLDKQDILLEKRRAIDICRIDKKDLKIEFEFLRPKESLAIRIVHEGDLFVCGELKSGNIVNVIQKSPLITKADFNSWKVLALSVWLASFFMLLTNSIARGTSFSLSHIFELLSFSVLLAVILFSIIMSIEVFKLCIRLLRHK